VVGGDKKLMIIPPLEVDEASKLNKILIYINVNNLNEIII